MWLKSRGVHIKCVSYEKCSGMSLKSTALNVLPRNSTASEPIRKLATRFATFSVWSEK